jgi:predicted lactoylglutathione lyase
MDIRFGMVVLIARDLQRSIDFYRLLGIDIADPLADRPVTLSALTDDVTLVITTEAFARFESSWQRPERGYQQLLEFLVDDDDAVDAQWRRLTSAGYHGRQAPAHTFGPYAAMVDDPDGNVTLITSAPAVTAGPAGV